MKLLKELISLTEDEATVVTPTKPMRKGVYHKDYLKTKDKPYRQYKHSKYKEKEGKD